MDEYINRAELIKNLNKFAPERYNALINQLITKQPADDVVKVVRCKDCRYWKDKNSKGTQGICNCGEMDMNYGGEFYPFANDFCSYAERKNEFDHPTEKGR